MKPLAELQRLYDGNRFLEAFRESVGYWNPSQQLGELSCDELILGGRLAARLGGGRLCRWLFRAALNRYPADPRLIYFTQGMRQRGRNLFADLRIWEENPELPGADPETQASWLGYQAVIWASLRDFERAHAWIARARSLRAREGVVFSFESDVLGLEDRWAAALESAELAWASSSGSPFAARNLGDSLMNLGRTQEAAERLAAAVEISESYEIAHSACWYLCAFAETLAGAERNRVLSRAKDMAAKSATLAPLADRETETTFARVRLDIAELEDDHAAMERWAKEARSPFHREALANLRKNSNGFRIRLPHRRAIQKHDACLPTSLYSAVAAMGKQIDVDAMASELTFGGTPEWAAAAWLEKLGLEVRFFAMRPEVATSLIKNGIAFVLTLDADASAHAVAAVGLDEAAGTLIIHDPQSFRTTEYLLASIGKNESPLGPTCMTAVPREKAAILDKLLPADDVAAITATEAHQQARLLRGPAAAREVVANLAGRLPSHPITKMLQAMQALDDGRVGAALVRFQELLREFPGSAFVRARLLSCCRALGDTALMRRTLESVVERGMLPGVQSQQAWRYPPSAYVTEYADSLRLSAATRDQARALLDGVILRERSCAPAWHVLADLLWAERDVQGALLAYRIASRLADDSAHYARAYCDALYNAGRQAEGLQYLENRVRRFGASSHAISTWITWIDALEDWGQPERALAACDESLKVHGGSAELLMFAGPLFARMGRWQEAENLLGRLEATGNSAAFHEAALDFHRRRGALDDAIQHAEAWAAESPLSMPARRELLQLIARRDGSRAALHRVTGWLAQQPGHDELEHLYCEYLDQSSSSRWKKYSLLLRRLKRNPEDGWAWRELAFGCLSEHESKNDVGRKKLERRIPMIIAQCERTAPEEAATLRVHARWSEARGEWRQAIDYWMEAITRDPDQSYGYRQAWDCAARCDDEQRKHLWQRISAILLSFAGRLSVAREVILMAARRFGVDEAERVVSSWKQMRPDDPEVTEAYADLLLEQGQGRTDSQRALEMLLPAAERFPYHVGLRFSLASAYRNLGKAEEAEEVFAEIIRRHPDSSAARIQLARVHERHGRVDEALKTLALAASLDPRNTDIRDVQAQVLTSAGRVKEAQAVIAEVNLRLRESVHWRERAIQLYVECGDNEAAVRTAREGIGEYPRGAYLWFVLGRTLHELPRVAAQGEVESCLRRSLELNQGLFDAADLLARLLVAQRRYAEAEQVMLRIRDRRSDPSPALGRLAWIRREKGEKSEARDEMAAALRACPWYGWGWNVLIEWIVEDKAWGDAQSLLTAIPPELKTNLQFRRQRLLALEKAGLPAAEMDSEWDSLLSDFPEDVSLYLLRYDSLRSAKRLPEAAAVLELIRPVAPESPYVLARFVEVLAGDQTKQEMATESILQIFFAEGEASNWPADYSWKAIQGARWEEAVYQKALRMLRNGSRPTARGLSILGSHAAQRGKLPKKARQPFWRSWFPDARAREILNLLKLVELASWPKEAYRGNLLTQLCDLGYGRLVVKYWKKNQRAMKSDVESWAQTGRALVNLKRASKARKFLADWRERTGVSMWVLANYALCLSALRRAQLREMLSTARDAMVGLPHDHTAKYLVHRQAEACALLGDTEAFRETWNTHRNYFDAKLGKSEWFEGERKHLLLDIPIMARALEGNDRRMYRRMLWGIRWKRAAPALRLPGLAWLKTSVRWWVVIWLLLWLLAQFNRRP